MSIPGIGAITATSFATAVEDPDNFKAFRSVGAWLGLTTRRYQSGQVDYEIMTATYPAEATVICEGFFMRQRRSF